MSRCKLKSAVLDGDILAYRAAWWAETEGSEYLEDRLTNDVRVWTPDGVTDVVLALSCKREDNFRREYLPSYKAHRDSSRVAPENLGYALELLEKNFSVRKYQTLEADDLMGIPMSRHTAIAVTIDKDIRTVPGWSWKPPIDGKVAEDLVYTTLEEADYNFYKQWIMGDTTDNISGVWKIGEAKAIALLESTSPKNYEALVFSLYEKMPSKDGTPYTYDYALSQARCVRILRQTEWGGSKVIHWTPKEILL